MDWHLHFSDEETEKQIGLGTDPRSPSQKMADLGIPALCGLPPAPSSSVAAFHDHPISFSHQMILNLHFCFSLREGLIPVLIAAINILIQGPFKMWE